MTSGMVGVGLGGSMGNRMDTGIGMGLGSMGNWMDGFGSSSLGNPIQSPNNSTNNIDSSFGFKPAIVPDVATSADFAAAASRQSSLRSNFQGDESLVTNANVLKQLMDAAAEDAVSICGKECRSALARVKRSIDDMFAEIAANWCALGLTEGDVSQRSTSLEAAIYTAVRPFLEDDRILVEDIQRAVLEARCECTALAMEGDDECRVSELAPLYLQLDELRKEKSRLKNVLEEQARELAMIGKKLPMEAQRMGLDPRQYGLSSDLTGAHGLSVAKKRLEMIQQRQEERIADAKRALENISHMQSQMNMQLKFVQAADDEPCTPNMAEGIVMLPFTDHNTNFVRFVHDSRWDTASRNDMLEPRYFLNLMRLEKEYTDFVQKRKRFWQAGFDRAYVNKTASFDADAPRELELPNDPFTYAARLKGEEADAATSASFNRSSLLQSTM